MKKIIFIIICIMFFNFNLDAQEESIYNVCVFLDVEFKSEELLYTQPGGTINKRLKQNFKDEDYIVFKILNKNDSMFYVEASYEIKGYIAKGWIKKDDNIGIYSRAYSKPLILYQKPNSKSKSKYILNHYNPKKYIVIECEGDWLKVKTYLNGKKYIGWMSPEMQCCNVYSTCN